MKLPEFVSKRLGTFSGKPRRSDDAATYYTTRAASIATRIISISLTDLVAP